MGTGVPPDADTRAITVLRAFDALEPSLRRSAENRMTSSSFQLPALGVGASQMVVGAPPPIAIFFSAPSAKNPRNRASGDQKGSVAPSVPGNGSASRRSNDRIHTRRVPPASWA